MLDHFNKNKAVFSVPEKRSLKLLVLDPAKFATGVTIADEDVRKAYESNKERYRTGERVKIRHILLKTTEKPKEEHPKIRAKLEGILKQIQGGADFAEMAKKNSEDTGSAVKGGDLDWVVRGQMVKNFEEASFSLKPKELSKVIQTEYGYHVLEVMAKEDARLKPFEEVKAELAGELKTQRSRDASQSALDSLQTAARKGVPNPEKLAAEFNLTLIPVDKAAASDRLPEIGKSPEMEAILRTLPKGGVSSPVPTELGRYVVAVVTDVFPAHAGEFTEFADDIRKQLEGSKLSAVTGSRANEIFARAQQAGDLKKVAQAMGLEVKSPPEFTRTGAVEGLGTGAFINDAFSKAPGSIIGPLPIAESFVIARVLSRQDADLALLVTQRDSIKEEIKARKSRERSEVFEDGLLQQLIKQGKVKIHDGVIKNLIANYRG
jgi:peptidyl-prolyl cis-trans isomerase D